LVCKGVVRCVSGERENGEKQMGGGRTTKGVAKGGKKLVVEKKTNWQMWKGDHFYHRVKGKGGERGPNEWGKGKKERILSKGTLGKENPNLRGHKKGGLLYHPIQRGGGRVLQGGEGRKGRHRDSKLRIQCFQRIFSVLSVRGDAFPSGVRKKSA